MTAAMYCHLMDCHVSCRVVWSETDLFGYSPDVEQSAGSAPQPSPPGPPRRAITPNMLVAYNMARWRRASELTQEQLGEQIGDWNKTAVSAAERSWDGKRVRQFDADLIATLASIFHVPIPAFFLPPPDDGEAARYVIESDDGGGDMPMEEFFAYVMPEPDWEADTPAATEYQQAVIQAAARYYPDSEAARQLAEKVRTLATEEQLAKALRTARENASVLGLLYESVHELVGDNVLLQDALTRALRATPEGQALIDSEQNPWSGLDDGTWTAVQAELARIGTQMFGETGPVSKEQLDEVLAEARRRGTYVRHAAVIFLADGSLRLPGSGIPPALLGREEESP